MIRILVFLLLLVVLLQLSQSAKLMRPVTLRTEINVKDSNASKIHFMQVKVSKDGQPIGIIVKRRDQGNKQSNSQNNRRNKKRKPKQQSDEEVQEITGVRVPDDINDRTNVYRNAQIVNNTLIMKKLLFSSFS